MQYADVYNQLLEGMQALVKGDTPISGDTHIVKDLGLDSLQVMELVMDVEDRLDLSIPVNVIADIHTVGEFARQVFQLVQANAAEEQPAPAGERR